MNRITLVALQLNPEDDTTVFATFGISRGNNQVEVVQAIKLPYEEAAPDKLEARSSALQAKYDSLKQTLQLLSPRVTV